MFIAGYTLLVPPLFLHELIIYTYFPPSFVDKSPAIGQISNKFSTFETQKKT